MLLRLLRLLPLLLLSAGHLSAQVYEPGLLVRANGDTLRGELENDFWVEPPTFVRYRPTPASPSQLLKASQVLAISFTGGRYFRREVLQLDHAAETRLESLVEGKVTDFQTDSVLAEVLLTGPVELLRVQRPGAAHYVVRRPGQPALVLNERRYLSRATNGSLQILDGNNYRNQLTLYFIDCPEARSASQTAAFTAPSLVGVMQAYATGCTTGQPPLHSWLAQAAPRRRGAFQAGLLAGARYNRISSPSYVLAGTCTDCQVHPFAGLYAELFQPSRLVAIYGELSVSPFRNRGTYDFGYDAAGQAVYAVFDYRATLATARIGVRYFFPLPHDRQVVLGLGFEHNEVLGLTVATVAGAYTRPNLRNEAFAAPTLLPNVMLGWRSQRFTVGLDAQLYHSADDATTLGNFFFGSSVATRLGLSYRLGRNPDAAAPLRAGAGQ